MFSYTKKSLYILTAIITLFIFCIIEHSVLEITKTKEIKQASIETIITTENNIKVLEDNIITLSNKDTIQNNLWQLEIPAISLIADIAEDTNAEVLNKNIGHFTDTPVLNGNVCLASHNRGASGAFFSRIKELNPNAIVIYRVREIERIYVVDLKTIIEETDFSYINNTTEDRLTLITCVENKPELRYYIQAIRVD